MMPLKKGSSEKTISKFIRELHSGPQFRKTKSAYGKAIADRQAVAIAMKTAGKSKRKS